MYSPESAANLVNETNPLMDGGYHLVDRSTVDWDDDGVIITRLRLVSDPGFPFWDVSYCHGKQNGKDVEVRLPFSQLPKKNMKSWLYQQAKKTGKFIPGLFTSISTLI
jgi:hypothetical protein